MRLRAAVSPRSRWSLRETEKVLRYGAFRARLVGSIRPVVSQTRWADDAGVAPTPSFSTVLEVEGCLAIPDSSRWASPLPVTGTSSITRLHGVTVGCEGDPTTAIRSMDEATLISGGPPLNGLILEAW